MTINDRLQMISELNRKIADFLNYATDEDFKKMFSECPSIKGDYSSMFGACGEND